MSRTDVFIDARGVTVRQELQSLSLLEVLPDLDQDGDAFLCAEEVRAGRLRIGAYVSAHYHLTDLQRDELLCPASEISDVELLPPDREAWFPSQDWVALTWRLDAPAVHSLAIGLDLFLDTSPGHVDHVRVTWRGHRPLHRALLADGTRCEFEPGASLLREAVSRSAREWFAAPFAFLLALALGCPSRRALLGAALAWLASSGLASVAGAHELITLDRRFVELSAALSIAYLAADVGLHPRARTRWIEALVFGAVHGLAGGAVFAEDAASGAGPAPLAAFVGVASLAAVVLLALAGVVVARLRAEDDGPLVRLRIAAALLVVVGLVLFARRAFL